MAMKKVIGYGTDVKKGKAVTAKVKKKVALNVAKTGKRPGAAAPKVTGKKLAMLMDSVGYGAKKNREAKAAGVSASVRRDIAMSKRAPKKTAKKK